MSPLEQTYVGARLTLGTGVLVLPHAAQAVWERIGGPGDVRALGARDLALSGALLATRDRRSARRAALAACAVSDALDAVVSVRAGCRSHHPLAWLSAGGGILGAAVGLALLRAR